MTYPCPSELPREKVNEESKELIRKVGIGKDRQKEGRERVERRAVQMP